MPENEDIWELWALSCTQWRATGFSVIGLDYNAVFKLAETYEIELTPAEFNKLRCLEARELERMAAKARREAEDKHHGD